MKNQTALIISVVVLIAVLGGGFLVVKNFLKPTNTPTSSDAPKIEYPPVDSSVEVNVKLKSDGKSVILSVAKIPAGTDSIDYEFNYITGEGLPKGAIGKIRNSDISGEAATKDVLLGTCSTGGKCTYDTGVKSVKVTLLFHNSDETKQFVKEFTL